MISAIVPVKFYDYRPVQLHLPNLTSEIGDLLGLPFADSSVKSISCMHVVEHIGLGRYGEPIDPDGDLKAMTELKRVLAPGGCLLFVTPVGKPKIDFNQHRIYSYEHIVDAFSGLTLKEFSLIPDDVSNGMIFNADPALVSRQVWGCGCFRFTK
jgi:SAM-dependent methyltransferase